MTDNDAVQVCWQGSAEEVSFLVEFLLWECEISQVPSVEQVTEWEAVLHKRGGRFERYAQMCAEWLKQQS